MTQKIWNGLAASFETAVCDVTTSSGKQLAALVRKYRTDLMRRRWSTPAAASAASRNASAAATARSSHLISHRGWSIEPKAAAQIFPTPPG